MSSIVSKVNGLVISKGPYTDSIVQLGQGQFAEVRESGAESAEAPRKPRRPKPQSQREDDVIEKEGVEEL